MGRGAKIVVGLLLLAGGFFCLNYTKGMGIEHHTEWAKQHGWPVPSYEIFLGGVGALGLGGIVLGHGLGKPSSK
jgi:hypothetical protein